MKRWGQRDFDACPQCDAPEDSVHVWHCHGSGTDEVWAQSLRKLETRLIKLETDPDLQLLLLALLDNWRFGTILSTSLPPYLCLLLQAQQRVGGHRLLEGWLVPEWGSLQQRFYTRIGSKQTGKRWLIAVIRKLWDTTWDLWDHQTKFYMSRSCT